MQEGSQFCIPLDAANVHTQLEKQHCVSAAHWIKEIYWSRVNFQGHDWYFYAVLWFLHINQFHILGAMLYDVHIYLHLVKE